MEWNSPGIWGIRKLEILWDVKYTKTLIQVSFSIMIYHDDDNYDDGKMVVMMMMMMMMMVMMVMAVVKRRWIEFKNYHVQVPLFQLWE